MLKYAGRRLLFVPFQLLAISILAFLLIRLIPGDPAYVISGPTAPPDAIERLKDDLGLNEPLWTQYGIYVSNVFQGDWGRSLFTSNSVLSDLADRLPATLELTSLALVLTIVFGIALGVYASVGGGVAVRLIRGYDMLSGAIPDFWFGLVAIFVFFTWLGWAPAPLGRLSPELMPPEGPTGFYTVDSLMAGNLHVFWDALKHLALPVLTLTIVNAGPVVKMMRSMMDEAQDAPYMTYARACGLPSRQRTRYAVRSALPPVVALLGVIYAYLLGGAVLVEKVFSWGGVGQYAVDSVTNSDFAPVQGFVLLAALFSMTVYLAVDLIHHALDPRLSQQ